MDIGGPLAGPTTITFREDVFLISPLPSPALLRALHQPDGGKKLVFIIPAQGGPFGKPSRPHIAAQDFWGHVPTSSRVLSGMGWMSPCRGSGTALRTLQFAQLSILQMPLGHKMKTNERLVWEKEYQGTRLWPICFQTCPKLSSEG